MLGLPDTIAPIELISAGIALTGICFDTWGNWDAFGDLRALRILRRLLSDWEVKRRRAQAYANIRHRSLHLGYQILFLIATLAAMMAPEPPPSEPETIAVKLVVFLCIIGIEIGLSIESIWDRFGRWRIHGIIRETRQGDPDVVDLLKRG
jgi:hypothetical protein